MTDNDNFLDRLRPDARQLRYEPDEMMSIRIAAHVRERIAESQTGIAQILARWFRPVVASLATLALVATLGIQWAEQSHDASSATSLDTLTSTQTVDISVGGDTFSVE
jgi:Mg2+/Co2+ transporter CorB